MQLLRATPGTPARAPHRGNRIEHHFQHGTLVDIGRRQAHRQRHPPTLHDRVALASRTPAIESSSARTQSPPFGRQPRRIQRRPRPIKFVGAPASDASSSWCSRSQTPACCQSRNRRQQVMPLPQPISWGSISQGIPVLQDKYDAAQHGAGAHAAGVPLGFGRLRQATAAPTTAPRPSLTSVYFIMPSLYHRFC